MQLVHLALVNWKNFKKAEAEFGRRVFLIGPNASGKSNFLDALRFLRDVSTSGLKQAVESRGGLSAIRCLSATSNNKVSLDVLLRSETDTLWRYKLVLVQDNNQRPTVVEELVERDSRAKLQRPDGLDAADPMRLTQTALEQISANKDFREVADFFHSISYQHIIPQAVRDPANFSSQPVVNDPFGRDFLLRLWTTSKRTRDARLAKISRALSIAVPKLRSLTAEMDEAGRPHLVAMYDNWRARGATQRENQFSDGTLRLLGLLWTCFEGSGPLLLEEPELSLHPEVVSRLPSIFSRIARLRKEADRQLFISTHSSDLLQDEGISAEEVLWLEPTDQGTEVRQASAADKESMAAGLTAADVLLPRSAPRGLEQLPLAFE